MRNPPNERLAKPSRTPAKAGGQSEEGQRPASGHTPERTCILTRRTADKAFVTVNARRDPALAARFPAEKPAADKPAAETPAATKPADSKPEAAKPSATTVERLSARAPGVEFEIPAYKYDSIFKSQDDLLEPAKK